MFLLHGHDQTMAKIALQDLVVAARAPCAATTFLRKWVTTCTDSWKHKLTEALCVIRASYIIRKLGMDEAELHERFMPHQPDYNVYLHPILKLLYHICEQMDANETRLVIAGIRAAAVELVAENGGRDHDMNCIEMHHVFEMHLLHALSEGLLVAGETEGRRRRHHCDVKVLELALKRADSGRLDGLRLKLTAAKNRLNCTVDNLIRAGKESKAGKESNSKEGEKHDISGVTEKFSRLDGLNGSDDSGGQNFKNPITEPNKRNARDSMMRYCVRRQSAGICLIINQKNFTKTNVSLAWWSSQLVTDKMINFVDICRH